MSKDPYEIVKEHLLIHVRLTPNARHDGLGGLKEDADGRRRLNVFVSVPPEKGKANKRAMALLAKALKVPKSAVSLAAGETSRNEVFKIAPPFDEALERLKAHIARHEQDGGAET